MANKPKPVEAYKCPKCSKLIVGTEEEAERHMTTKGTVLPKGLVYSRKLYVGDPGRAEESWLIAISSELDEEHNSQNRVYQVRSGNYGCHGRSMNDLEYIPNGIIGGESANSFIRLFGAYSAPTTRFLTPGEFNTLVMKFRNVDLSQVERDIQYLNENRDLDILVDQGIIPGNISTRIDLAILKQHGLGANNLIRTTPELEKLAKKSKRYWEACAKRDGR